MTDAFAIPLSTTRTLTRAGLTGRQINRHVQTGAIKRVRRGIYVSSAETGTLTPEQWRILRARAWQAASDEPPVFSHATAAAVHGLPVFRSRDERTHVITPNPRDHLAPDISRHRGSTDAGVIEVRGLLITDLARTMSSVARFDAPEAAVAVADAALRSVREEQAALDRLRRDALDWLTPRTPGAARATELITFADPRADRPGESISRIYLHRLGFAAPRLQVELTGPGGTRYFVDFGLDDIRAFGEFDGEAKYTDPLFLAGRTPQQALLDEKRREDWIRGTTGWRILRWEMTHLASVRTLAARLAAFGVAVPRP
jgi:hypothetical protein